MTHHKEVLAVSIEAAIPTVNGCALFLGNEEKTFVIYIDQSAGNSIRQILQGEHHERPRTHELMGTILASFGAKIDRVIINELKGATYYARLILSVENELQQRKVIELDGRPSDCLTFALLQNSPVYVAREVWNKVENMSEVLSSVKTHGLLEQEDSQG